MAGATGTGRSGHVGPKAPRKASRASPSAEQLHARSDASHSQSSPRSRAWPQINAGSILAGVALPTQPAVLAPLSVLCLTVFICFGLVTSLSMQTTLLRDSIARDLAASVALEGLDTGLAEARNAFDLPHRANRGLNTDSPVIDRPARQRMVAAVVSLDQLRRDLSAPPSGQPVLQERDPELGRIIAGLERAEVRMRKALGPGAVLPEFPGADPVMADPVRADPVTPDQARAELQALSQLVGVHRAAITSRARLQAQQAIAVGARAQDFALAGMALIICLATGAVIFGLSEARLDAQAATRNGFRLGRVRRA